MERGNSLSDEGIPHYTNTYVSSMRQKVQKIPKKLRIDKGYFLSYKNKDYG